MTSALAKPPPGATAFPPNAPLVSHGAGADTDGARAAEAPVGEGGEAIRIAQLKEILGHGDPALAAFPEAIRRVVFAKHDAHVRPLYEAHWPEALQGPTHKKLRFLSCNLYATAPYTVLFSSPTPPVFVRLARGGGVLLGLSEPAMAKLCGAMMRPLAALLPEALHRRIVQIAAFIAALDHVMDKCTVDIAPKDRGARMRAALAGTWSPTDGETEHAGAFRFLHALAEAMGAEIDDEEDREVYARAFARIEEFIDSEVKAMTGVPDPTGLEHRMAGVLGTIDGLIFPVHRYAGEQARRWMYDVSLFVQVMDDYIDLDKDKLDLRSTPCITGAWTIETVRSTWQKTLDGIVALAQASGVDDPRYLAFVRDTYRMMTIEVMEAMCRGSAA
jgi:hypothetical protein